ncbi:2-hydroxyacid dehydrogenase [Pseudomonas sp. zbq_11]|uniref:2-hydroxyacid dehydrogenase n=1 Tax=unclassified Pseudomonas TaxID=196821 RepID=UPI00370A4587
MNTIDIVVAPGPWDPEPWRKAFEARCGTRKVHLWPHDGEEVDSERYVICAWKAGEQIFEELNRPEAVFSMGAGVDHLACLASQPNLPIGRIRDPDLTMRMVEYVTFATLYLHRQIAHYQAEQAAGRWAPVTQAAASDVRIGILGVGVLGKACGLFLQQLGFQVAGWARSSTEVGFKVFNGREGLVELLQQTDILVNLLPNTQETHGVIDRQVFENLSRSGKQGAPAFINAGRGEAVIHADLQAALREGTLSGAVLDVFGVEPLPSDDPLWSMPGVLLTPHVAADSEPDVVVGQILHDVFRLEAGQPLEHPVDLGRGY